MDTQVITPGKIYETIEKIVVVVHPNSSFKGKGDAKLLYTGTKFLVLSHKANDSFRQVVGVFTTGKIGFFTLFSLDWGCYFREVEAHPRFNTGGVDERSI